VDASADSTTESADASVEAGRDTQAADGNTLDVTAATDGSPNQDSATAGDASLDATARAEAGADASSTTLPDGGQCVGSRSGLFDGCRVNDDCCSHNCEQLISGSGGAYTMCGPNGALGYCTTGDDCITGNCVNHQCQPSPLKGTCAADSDCASGLFCSVWVGCCVGRGGACQSDSDCCLGETTGACQNGACHAPCVYSYTPGGVSQIDCGSHNDCCSDTCSSEVCAPSGYNQPCRTVLDCAAGLNQCPADTQRCTY
jgi:hypothetical protein